MLPRQEQSRRALSLVTNINSRNPSLNHSNLRNHSSPKYEGTLLGGWRDRSESARSYVDQTPIGPHDVPAHLFQKLLRSRCRNPTKLCHVRSCLSSKYQQAIFEFNLLGPRTSIHQTPGYGWIFDVVASICHPRWEPSYMLPGIAKTPRVQPIIQ